MKLLITSLIRFYQRTLSPDHGLFRFFFPWGYCQYYPSCSSYAIEAVEKRGFYGLFLAGWRILRCNPWSKGGIDRVPVVNPNI